MNWLISVHFYLWRNSLRRWREQPLSLLSKLVVPALLGILGAVVMLGTRNLGDEIDRRLRDRDALTVLISETVASEVAPGMLAGEDQRPWESLGEGEAHEFLQVGASARTEDGRRLFVAAVRKPERYGLLDEFYLLSDQGPVGEVVRFQLGGYWSEATRKPPLEEAGMLFQGRPTLLGSVERLSVILGDGYTSNSVVRAASVEEIQKIHDVAGALRLREEAPIILRSNLMLLRELEQIRALQDQALVAVSAGSSAVLALIFGSLAWLEFREERYVLALLRSFGVGRLSLLAHAATENALLALLGVLGGMGLLRAVLDHLGSASLGLAWLGAPRQIIDGDGILLVIGAVVGGTLCCVPIGFALRKPIGLVLG